MFKYLWVLCVSVMVMSLTEVEDLGFPDHSHIAGEARFGAAKVPHKVIVRNTLKLDYKGEKDLTGMPEADHVWYEITPSEQYEDALDVKVMLEYHKQKRDVQASEVVEVVLAVCDHNSLARGQGVKVSSDSKDIHKTLYKCKNLEDNKVSSIEFEVTESTVQQPNFCPLNSLGAARVESSYHLVVNLTASIQGEDLGEVLDLDLRSVFSYPVEHLPDSLN